MPWKGISAPDRMIPCRPCAGEMWAVACTLFRLPLGVAPCLFDAPGEKQGFFTAFELTQLLTTQDWVNKGKKMTPTHLASV